MQQPFIFDVSLTIFDGRIAFHYNCQIPRFYFEALNIIVWNDAEINPILFNIRVDAYKFLRIFNIFF